MISEQECRKILNCKENISQEEVKSIMTLISALATIQYEDFIQQDSKNDLTNQLPEKAA